MLIKIKQNKYLILFTMAFIALALIIPSIYTAIDNIRNANDMIANGYPYESMRNQEFVLLAQYACYAACDILLLIVSSRKQLTKSYIILTIALYYTAQAALPIYNLIVNGSFSSLYSVSIDILVAIFTILALTNIRYKYPSILLLLVDIAFLICGVFQGSTASLSTVLLSSMLVIIILVFTKQEESTYNNQYYN